jgi:Bacterial Ig domain/Repeat of unknown function (DUF5648)/NHL repeat
MRVCTLIFRWLTSATSLRLMFVATVSFFVLCLSGAPRGYAMDIAVEHDHLELDATIDVPYQSAHTSEARVFRLQFAYPSNAASQVARWQVELRAPSGAVVNVWRGAVPIVAGSADVSIAWAGRVGENANLADGIYTVHMSALGLGLNVELALSDAMTALEEIASHTNDNLICQSWEIRIGNTTAPKMPDFLAMKTNEMGKKTALSSSNNTGSNKSSRIINPEALPSIASLPYTVYYGNLHSQTNHSDGGGNLATCDSSEAAQKGQFGPADAFAYGKNAGLDVLMTSEHNHYFDGSSGTNGAATFVGVRNLFQSGLVAAANFNAGNPSFLALYGLEWGVTDNGGHLNIFGSNELFGWETNASGQLLADVLTPKSDYAAIYATMKQRGLLGQFNHPDSTGQFVINGTSLAYSADGDEVMALAEILNSSAFSNNNTETETSRRTFEREFNLLLERGYHVAPTSNQDNHCANWGSAYTNRTAVLLPNGAALNTENYLAALKARRVFATMDKNSQLVLTANGRVMGERFQNSGTLLLKANFASSIGRTAATVTIFEGVPGRNGAVTALASVATTSITPALGKHFYYAKVTQNDGKILWSAPIWVEQVIAILDVVPPQVSVSSASTNGTIIFTATASDNVGITRVEFYIDNILTSILAAEPYAFSFLASNLEDGTHSAVAKAIDAAGNVGTSAIHNFIVANKLFFAQSITNILGTGILGGVVLNDVALAGLNINPSSITTDRDGNIFFTNANGLIYRISSRTGRLFTIGGIGSVGFSGDDGLAVNAAFNGASSIVFGSDGLLYVADTGNNRVRRIDTKTGIVTTVVGGGSSGADNIQGTAAQLLAPRSLAFGPDGLLYIADGSHRIRRLNLSTGVLSFFAGTGAAGYSGNNGAALSAMFNDIYHIAFDFQGNLYLVDRGNNRIRSINRAGIVSAVAGNGATGFAGDGALATTALFRDIRAIAFDFFGQLYIADVGNARIRRVNLLTGLIDTLSVGVGAATSSFNAYGLHFDVLGSLYIAELGQLRVVRYIDSPSFAFNFPTRGRIAANAFGLSDIVRLSNFSGLVTLSIDSGEYNIGCDANAPWSSATQQITVSNPAQAVCLRVRAGAAAGDTRTANFRVNNSSSPFTVLTLDPELLPRYRIYVPSLRRHLYTTDTNEYNVLTSFSTYTGEGISHYVYKGPTTRAAQTGIPYYRLYFIPQQRHFYTSDFNEYNSLRAVTTFASDEGITGHIFPRYGVPGATALYRLYSPAINSHLWTIDSNEFNVLRQNGWIPEGQPGNATGVDGYVFP